MKLLLAAMHESPCGTNRPKSASARTSTFGGKPETYLPRGSTGRILMRDLRSAEIIDAETEAAKCNAEHC